MQESRGPTDYCSDTGGWEVLPSLGITMCWYLVRGHIPDRELPQVGVWSLSFPGSIEPPHLGLRDIANRGATTHGHLELTDPQTSVRTNCFLSPVNSGKCHAKGPRPS